MAGLLFYLLFEGPVLVSDLFLVLIYIKLNRSLAHLLSSFQEVDHLIVTSDLLFENSDLAIPNHLRSNHSQIYRQVTIVLSV